MLTELKHANPLTLSVRVLQEDLDDVKVGSAREGVTANADTQRLAKTDVGCLRNSLVREGTRPRDDTWHVRQIGNSRHCADVHAPILPGVWMWPGWMPILQPRGLMIPGQLGPTRRDLDWLLRAFMTCSGRTKTGRRLNGGVAIEF